MKMINVSEPTREARKLRGRFPSHILAAITISVFASMALFVSSASAQQDPDPPLGTHKNSDGSSTTVERDKTYGEYGRKVTTTDEEGTVTVELKGNIKNDRTRDTWEKTTTSHSNGRTWVFKRKYKKNKYFEPELESDYSTSTTADGKIVEEHTITYVDGKRSVDTDKITDPDSGKTTTFVSKYRRNKTTGEEELIERSVDGVIDRKRYKYNPATGGLERIEDAKDPEEDKNKKTEEKKTDEKKTDDSTPQPAKPEEKKEKSSGSGLKTEEVPTQYGTVVFALPDDLAAGDTISGTVTAVPFGNTDAERSQNLGELNGYVVQVQQERSRPGNVATVIIPPGSTTISLLLLDRLGKPQALETVPVAERGQRTVRDYSLPAMGQTGRNVRIVGPLSGDLGRTEVNIANKPARILAESPREVIVTAPSDVIGKCDMVIRENGREVARGTYRNVGISLSATKTALRKGERTVMTVAVSGLDGIIRPVSIRLINRSTTVVHMDGGDDQNISVSAGDLRGGSYSRKIDLTGISQGAFQITASLLLDDDAPPARRN